MIDHTDPEIEHSPLTREVRWDSRQGLDLQITKRRRLVS